MFQGSVPYGNAVSIDPEHYNMRAESSMFQGSIPYGNAVSIDPESYNLRAASSMFQGSVPYGNAELLTQNPITCEPNQQIYKL